MTLIVRQNVAGREIGAPLCLDRRRRRLSTVMARHSVCRTRPQVVAVRRRDEPWTAESVDFLPQKVWAHTLVGPHDTVVIVDLPLGGAAGGATGGAAGNKKIGGAIAMIALALVAPWAAGAIAGSGTLLASVLTVGIIAGGAYLVGKATTPKANKPLDSSPVYGVSGGGNQPRPGDRIPRNYGTFWTQPDLTQPDYITYDGDDQILFKRVTLGLGKYNIREIQIGSGATYATLWKAGQGVQPTFPGALIEIVPPGGGSNLVPGTVVSSALVQGQTLPTPSDNPAFAGPFAITGLDTKASRIQLDYSLPGGVSSTFTNSKGTQSGPMQWGVLFECAPCNEDNDPIGPWQTLYQNSGYQQSARALRFTAYANVDPAHRYIVRARDTVGGDTGNPRVTGTVNAVQWDGLRGHVTDTIVRPHVTEIAIQVRSGKALGITAFAQVYVQATAVLPVWTGTAWVEQETNKAVWAYADVLRASYGGNVPDSEIDLARLKFYADTLSSNDTFDGVIRGPVSVYDAASTVLGPLRAEPARLGNAWSMMRDEAGSIRKHVFTRRQIVRDSTSTNFKLAMSDGSADVICEYYPDCDPRRRREVRSTFGEASTTPRRISLTGVSSYEHALHHAKWVAGAAYYRRETRAITSEYEGRLVQRGDSALIDAWFMSRGRAAGVVARAGGTLTLDTDLDLQPDSYAVLRNRRNREWGPVRVTAGGAPNVVVLNAEDVTTNQSFYNETLDAVFADADADSTSIVVGPVEWTAERFIIQSATPQGSDRVAITAINDNDLLWAALNEAPAPEPPIPGTNGLADPAIPIVPWIRALAVQKGGAVFMEWSVGSTRGAAQIVVELTYGTDFTTKERVSENTATSGSYPLAHYEGNENVTVRAWAVGPGALVGPTVLTTLVTFKPKINNQTADVEVALAQVDADFAAALAAKDVATAEARGAADAAFAYADEVQAALDANVATLNENVEDARSKATALVNDIHRALSPDPAERGRVVDTVLRGLRDEVAQLSEALASVQDQFSRHRGAVLEAGVEQGPDGVYRIYGLAKLTSETSTRLNSVAVTLSALDARISLITTTVVSGNFDAVVSQITTVRTDLDALKGTLTNYVLQADFTAATTRISTAETKLDAQEGLISSKASQLALEGLTFRTTTAEQSISALGAIVNSVSATSGIADAELRGRALDDILQLLSSATGALVQDYANATTAIGARIDGTGRAIAEQSTRLTVFSAATAATFTQVNRTVADGLSAEATARTALAARTSAAEAGLVAETSARATADSATTTSLNAAISRIGAAEASIISEAGTRLSADTATTNSLNAALSRLGTAEAAITSEVTTRASADSANTSAIAATTSRVGTAEARIVAEENTRASAVGGLASRTSGLEYSLYNPNGEVPYAHARITNEESVRYAADQANTNSINAAVSRLGTAEGRIANEENTRATQTSANATRIGAVEATVYDGGTGLAATRSSVIDFQNSQSTTNSAVATRLSSVETYAQSTNASSTSFNQARIDGDNALGARIDQVSVRANNATASGALAFVAVSTPAISGAYVAYSLRLTANNTLTGFTFVSKTDGSSAAVIDASTFMLRDPNVAGGVPQQLMTYDSGYFNFFAPIRIFNKDLKPGAVSDPFGRTFTANDSFIALPPSGGDVTQGYNEVPGCLTVFTTDTPSIIRLSFSGAILSSNGGPNQVTMGLGFLVSGSFGTKLYPFYPVTMPPGPATNNNGSRSEFYELVVPAGTYTVRMAYQWKNVGSNVTAQFKPTQDSSFTASIVKR